MESEKLRTNYEELMTFLTQKKRDLLVEETLDLVEKIEENLEILKTLDPEPEQINELKEKSRLVLLKFEEV